MRLGARRNRAAPPSRPGADRDPMPALRAAAFTLRRATPDDLEEVVRLRLALLREHSASPVYGRVRRDAAEVARGLFASQLASPVEITWLAVGADGEAIGILRCVETVGSPLLVPARYAYVSSVYVTPGARRRGVLRALLAEAEQWSRARGLTEIRLHSTVHHPQSGAVWDALGFEPVEQLRRRPIRPN